VSCGLQKHELQRKIIQLMAFEMLRCRPINGSEVAISDS